MEPWRKPLIAVSESHEYAVPKAQIVDNGGRSARFRSVRHRRSGDARSARIRMVAGCAAAGSPTDGCCPSASQRRGPERIDSGGPRHDHTSWTTTLRTATLDSGEGDSNEGVVSVNGLRSGQRRIASSSRLRWMRDPRTVVAGIVGSSRQSSSQICPAVRR
jgi:hypothetical protein